MKSLRSFFRDTKAAVAFEAVIITPILAWCFVGSFIFFDAFRTYSTSLKATYAVADILSRQTETIYASDIEGLSTVFEHIARNPAGGTIRVSQISWDGDEFSVDWSHGAGSETRLRDSDIPDISSQLPIVVEGERLILVESFVPYQPYFNIGLGDVDFTNFTVTRPRFAGQLPYDDGVAPYCSSCNFGEDELGDSSGDYIPIPDDDTDDDD